MPSARRADFFHLLRYINAKWHCRDIPAQSFKRKAAGHLGAVTSTIPNKSAAKYELAVVPHEAEHLQLELAEDLCPKPPRLKAQGQLWKQEKTAKTCQESN